ncbi:MAG: TolC family protein [Planctomycetes bacterium]|nr:TolC family protein [Planctomycetota bacterium]MBI3845585.1 TolC family protein [Planctomycetota bacterium]
MWNGRRRLSSATLLVAFGCTQLEYVPSKREQPSGPMSLDDAVALALRNNPDVAIARERANAARAAIDEATSQYWPSVAFEERFTRTSSPSRAFGNILDQRRFDDSIDFNDPGDTSNFRTGFAASLTLYDFGRRRARVSAAEATADAIAAQETQVRRDVAFEVARAYFLVFKARASAAAGEELADTLRRHATIVQARVDEGAARRTDVLEAQMRLSEDREATIVSRMSAARAEAALRVLLGLGVEEPIELLPPTTTTGTDGAVVGATENPSLLFARARQHRAEIVRAQKRIDEAAAGVDAARASAYPDLSLSGDVGFDDRDPRLGHASWLFGLGFLESLTDILRAPSRVRQAVANLAVAHESARSAQLEVERDVRNALLDAEEANAHRDVAAEALALAEEVRRRVQAEFDEGASEVSQLLDSDVAMITARTRLASAGYDQALSRISIAHAVGEYPPLSADGAGRGEEP